MINVFMGILLYLNNACQTAVQFVYVHSLCNNTQYKMHVRT